MLALADGIPGLHVDHRAHALEVREVVSDGAVDMLKNALIAVNATHQTLWSGSIMGCSPWKHARSVGQGQICFIRILLASGRTAKDVVLYAICDSKNDLLVFDQIVSGRMDFRTLGRRAFSMQI